jgi:hypothetical protein
MAHVVPKVKLDDLTPLPSGMASPAFATAAEQLAVGLSKNRVVVVALPCGQGATLMNALVALLGPGTLSLPGCDVREWQAGGAYISADVEQVSTHSSPVQHSLPPCLRPQSLVFRHALHMGCNAVHEPLYLPICLQSVPHSPRAAL